MITDLKDINPSLRFQLPETTKRGEYKVTDFSRRKLDVFYQHWLSLAENRLNWQKWGKYYNDDQWHEFVSDGKGGFITEKEYISKQGKVPLQQNIIQSTCNSVLGQYRTNRGKSVIVARVRERGKEADTLSNALGYVHSFNMMKEVDSTALEQKLITGLPIQMIRYKYLEEEKRYDVWVDNISPFNIFFNSDARDVRGSDIRIIGRLIDMTFPELAMSFGQNSKERIEQLKEVYRYRDDIDYIAGEGLSSRQVYDTDFFLPRDLTQCRVIEAWEKVVVMKTKVHDWADGSIQITDYSLDEIKEMNRRRIQMFMEMGRSPEEVPLMEAETVISRTWHYQFLSPFGHILAEGETPYWHGSHHFVMPLFQMVDGKLNSFVSSLIDQQRYINRIVTLWDFILGTSAKNTLILDRNSLDGQSVEDISETYREVGGVIVLNLKDGAKPPVELSKNMGQMGIVEMIQFHMKTLQDISGVHSSLQGKDAKSGTPASLYAQEAHNASLNIKSLIDSFHVFRKLRDTKIVKTIQQFYNEPRWITVAGSDHIDSVQMYDPKDVQDLEFTLEVSQSADSPVYRNIIDEQLKEFLMAGFINFETYLKNTNLPFSEKIIEDVRRAKDELEQGNIPGAMQNMSNAQQSVPAGDPKAMSMLDQSMKQF